MDDVRAYIKQIRVTVSVFGIIVLLTVGALLLLAHKTDSYEEVHTIGTSVESFEELSDRFATLARDKGAPYAFEVLRRAALPPQTDLHLLGHTVGDELYAQQGLDGIRVCTPEFRNACSHSIVIGALAEFGDESLPLIRDACRKAPGGSGAYTMCFHGLGHGVFAGYGYSLPETIEFCERTGTPEYFNREYHECFGGAVMELMGGGGHDTHLWERAREKYLDGPLGLCLSEIVPEELRPICTVYATPHIWESVGINLAAPEADKFADAFAICNEIPESMSAVRAACYGGFGKEFLPLVGSRDIREVNNFTEEQLSRPLEWCSYAHNEDGIMACTSEVLNSLFWGGENDARQSFRLCALVDESPVRDVCYMALARNIAFFMEGHERETVCKQLPEIHQHICATYENI